MSLLATREFLLIMGLGLVVAGLTTYVITWMLVSTHLRDHHPAARAQLAGFMLAPAALGWYLGAKYRALGDRGLDTLAVLGLIGAWSMLIGAAIAIVSKLLAIGGGGA